MLIDTHAHLNFPDYQEDLEAVLKRARDHKVERIINVAIDRETMEETVSLVQGYENLYGAVGVHPHHAGEYNEETARKIRMLTNKKRIIAVGEIGLDYYRNRAPRSVQREAFRSQLVLANDIEMPVIIHDRDAHTDVLDIIIEVGVSRGVFHCFSGDVEFARQVLDLGFYVSLAGPVTFKNAGVLIDVARFIPLDRLMVETDCPFLTPRPYRGKRNEPAYVKFVAQQVAKLKGISEEALCEHLKENVRRLFGIV